MSLDTYAELKTEIADHLDRDDLTSKIDTFIDLVEVRHKDEIRFRPMLKRAQITVDEQYLALPASFLQMRTFRLLTDPVTVLAEVNLEKMNRLRTSTAGTPGFFTVHEEIEFDRAPDTSTTYTGEMIYWAELEALSDSNTSNALLDRSPGCYLYGALAATSPYLEDDRIEEWEGLYRLHRDSLLRSDRASRHGASLVSRVTGATP